VNAEQEETILDYCNYTRVLLGEITAKSRDKHAIVELNRMSEAIGELLYLYHKSQSQMDRVLRLVHDRMHTMN